MWRKGPSGSRAAACTSSGTCGICTTASTRAVRCIRRGRPRSPTGSRFSVPSIVKRASRRSGLPNPESAANGFQRREVSLFPLAEWAILLVVALGALYFQLSLPGMLATEQAYREVAAVLANEGREGDVVLLHPWWTERARLFVPKAIPVVGYLGSDGDPLSSYSRIWWLAQPRLPRSDLCGCERGFLPCPSPVCSPRH